MPHKLTFNSVNICAHISESKMEQRIYVSDIIQDVSLDNISEGH